MDGKKKKDKNIVIDKNRVVRMKAIHKILLKGNINGNKKINSSTLSEVLECSRKTILRDLEAMNTEWEAKIEYNKREYSFYYTSKNFILPAIHMSESEYFSFLISERVLENYKGTPIYDTLKDSFAKIEQVLDDSIADEKSYNVDNMKKNIIKLKSNFTFLNNSFPKIDTTVWLDLLESIKNQKKIQITYKKIGKNEFDTVIRPYHIVSYKRKFYVIGDCEQNGERRTYSLSRIKSTRIQTDGFPIPDNLDVEAEIKKNYGIFTSNKKLEVLAVLHPPISGYFLEEEWKDVDILEQYHDNSIKVKIKTSEFFEVKNLLFSYGKYAEVLEPKSLREEIAKDHLEAVNTYKQK